MWVCSSATRSRFYAHYRQNDSEQVGRQPLALFDGILWQFAG
jgi:hypothetical protein